ncbi:MAG: RNA methyltransferase [Bacteroidales bacterium]|nr:MAG: RNA methyltransferase [Bacteroidales bacterium]
MVEKFEMIAKTQQGLEDVLAEELRSIGAEEVNVALKSVSFKGNKEMLYKANIQLRTALRILKPIYTFKARTEDELYGQAKKFDWSSLMNISQKYAVDSVVTSDVFNHSRYIALKLKDAIADHFREKTGKRPFVDPQNPQIRVHIHVVDEECTISLDSSGESLHRRGYRQTHDASPINEVLAAGMILLSGWKGQSDFIDPMCGSGTILIEAGLIAHGIPPGIFRKHFGFENWVDFDEELLQQVYNDESMEREFKFSIIGSDISKKAIETSVENIRNAGLQKKIEISTRSVFEFDPPKGKGIVVTNPPYGERLKKEQIESFYRQLGDCFKQRYSGYDVWLISNNVDALRSFGLRPSRAIALANGALECKYHQYSMYKGSPKEIIKKTRV